MEGLDVRCFFVSEERDELYHCIDTRCEDMLLAGEEYYLSSFSSYLSSLSLSLSLCLSLFVCWLSAFPPFREH
jgi:hypothetical protein